mmetsp:Transcript_17388/g.49779  ORF Transcript_17388/g.49779 Transcript_17388/m.49779 type:complete len:268 (+) Transcript_17388:117-920(+)
MDLKHLSLLFVELCGIHIERNVKSVGTGQGLPFRATRLDLGMRVLVGSTLLVKLLHTSFDVGIFSPKSKVGIKSHLGFFGTVGKTDEDLLLEDQLGQFQVVLIEGFVDFSDEEPGHPVMSTRSKAINVLLDGPSLGFWTVGALPSRILQVVEEGVDSFHRVSEHGKQPARVTWPEHLDCLHKVGVEEHHVGQTTFGKAQTTGTGQIRERCSIDVDELASLPWFKDIKRIVRTAISHISSNSRSLNEAITRRVHIFDTSSSSLGHMPE